jgi:hypothetical protein
VGDIISGQAIPQFRREQLDTPEALAREQASLLATSPLPEAQQLGLQIFGERAAGTGRTRGSALERLSERIMEESAQRGQPIDFTTALSLARSGLGQGLTFQEGQVAPIAGALESREQLARAREAGAQRAKTQFEPERVGRREEAKLAVERREAFPRLQQAFESSNAKSNVVTDTIDEVLPNVGILTAGFLSPTANIPGTPAADLKANIDTILANIGFEELQAMRDNSPTGGALGQVAVRELELLQATRANIANSQSPEQLRRNLVKLPKQIIQSRESLNRGFNTQAKRAGIEPGDGAGADLKQLSTEEIIMRLPEEMRAGYLEQLRFQQPRVQQ